MTCSDQWADLPALGTAPTSRFWLAVEQDGPWGQKALVESGLDPDVGRQLGRLADGHGGHVVLVRDPLDHVEQAGSPHRVLLAGGPWEHRWIGATTVQDPAELVGLLQAWLAGDVEAMPGWLEPTRDVLLVCTNAKRDRCCALKGRPVAVAMAREFGERVWESSHLHGHRFAATALALPSGQMFARVDEALARRVVTEGTPLPVGPVHDRGLVWLPAALQVADTVVRDQLPPDRHSSLDFEGPDADGVVTVMDRDDQRTWRVRVSKQDVPDALPKSCGKAPEPGQVWQGELL